LKNYPYWWEFYKPYHLKNCEVKDRVFDLVIVGSGYTGISASIEANHQNFNTLVIDQFALGEGASTRSAGMISGGLNLGKKVNLFKKYGNSLALDFIQESIDSYKYLEETIVGSEEKVFYQKTGRLVLAHSQKKLLALQEKTNLLNKVTQLQVELLNNLERELPNNFYKGGMLVKDAASIHPSLFYKFLLDKTINLGTKICTPCKLISYKKENDCYLLNTTEGSLKTKYLLFATNGYSSKEIGDEHNKIIGIPSYISVSNELGEETIHKLMPNLRMYSDTKNDLFYFRPTPDHRRLLFGAFPIWAANQENSSMVKNFFLKKIPKILPNMPKFELDYIWGGKVGVTFNTLPEVNKIDNRIYVFGCNGSGVALMPYLGHRSISLLQDKRNSKFVISQIHSNKNYLKNIIIILLPLLGFYYRLKENLENKFN